ncbi:MAG: copper resistance protein B [Gammaproteobacteria bacterium]|nr:copper resistance protein B [Gammaproteobacteria bacterium]
MINNRVNLIAVTAALAFNVSSSWGQDSTVLENTPAYQAAGDHADHSSPAKRTPREARRTKKITLAPAKTSGEQETMPDMDHGAMDHDSMPAMEKGGMSGTAPDSGKTGDMSNMNHDSGGMNHGAMPMQGGSAPPDARDPHAHSDGYDFGPIPRPRMGDEDKFGSLLIDQFERVVARDNSFTFYNLQARFGRDYDRAVLKAEGNTDGGKFRDAHTELLWGHAVAPFWDTQLGARYDSGTGPDRRWLAFGVQGLAPYWFNVEATAYAGEQGRSMLRFATEYELLLTQKMILQPRVEANLYGMRDIERALGSGLSDLAVGLRLRYEIRREFAPYVGVEWASKFGGTADYARNAGQKTAEARAVAGVRFWF